MIDVHARYECGYQEIVVGLDAGVDRGDWCLVFDGFDRRETVIRFDRVEIERHEIVLIAKTLRESIKTGSLEGSPEAFGAVGEWLAAFAEDGQPPEVVPRA